MDRILTLAADEGFETLELYGGGWEVAGDLRKAAEELRRLADDRGVTLPVYGSGTRLGSIGVRREPNMKHLKVETEVCSILGGTVMTYPVVDGQPVPTDQPDAEVGIRFEKMLPVLVEQVQELADHACAFGVDIAVLNHCFLVYLGWRIGRRADLWDVYSRDLDAGDLHCSSASVSHRGQGLGSPWPALDNSEGPPFKLMERCLRRPGVRWRLRRK